MIENILEQALRMDETEKAAHLAKLAQTPETSLKALADLLQQSDRRRAVNQQGR